MGKLPRDFFFGAVVFALVITGVVSMINLVVIGESGNKATAVPGLMGNENINDFEDVFNNNVTGRVNAIKAKMDVVNPEAAPQNIFTLSGAFISSAWEAVKLVFSSVTMMDDAIGGMESMLHIPGWVVGFILVLIVAFFIFSILTVIFGKDI